MMVDSISAAVPQRDATITEHFADPYERVTSSDQAASKRKSLFGIKPRMAAKANNTNKRHSLSIFGKSLRSLEDHGKNKTNNHTQPSTSTNGRSNHDSIATDDSPNIEKFSISKKEFTMHPEFLLPEVPKTDKPKIRPAYERSISFQSQSNENPETSSIASANSTIGSKERMDPADNVPDSHSNSPRKLRQRSKTLSDVQGSDNTGNKTPGTPSVIITPSKYVGFGNTPTIHTSKSSSNMLSSLAHFVKSKRSSSLTVDLPTSSTHGSSLHLLPLSAQSDRNSFSACSSHSGNHSTPPSSASTDYFSHHARAPSIVALKSASPATVPEVSVSLRPKADETPQLYVERLIKADHVAEILAEVSVEDPKFNMESLRHYMGFFDFKSELIDISLRKLLAFNELPKETQQIDRVCTVFAEEYCKQNPHLSYSPDICFILVFSLLMLHTDRFNPNNRNKMTKSQFVKIVRESLQSYVDSLAEDKKQDVEFVIKNIVTRDILDYYYDNITYTPCKRLDEYPKEFFFTVNNHKASDFATPANDELVATPTEISQNDLKNIIRANLSTASLSVGGITSRKRASSFFSVTSSSTTDIIYDYILGARTKEDLKIGFEFQTTNPFVGMKHDGNENECDLVNGTLEKVSDLDEDNILMMTEDRIDEVDEQIYAQFMERFMSSAPQLLMKISRDKVNDMFAGIKLESYDEEDQAKDVMIRVLKHGIVYRAEKKKLTSAVVWKSYYALLTSLGLFFYKDINLLKLHDRSISNTNAIVFEEYMAEPSSIVYTHGLFAMKNDYDKDKTGSFVSKLESLSFTVYGKNSKETCSVTDRDDLREWIYTINYLVALNDCFLTYDVNSGSVSTVERDEYTEIRPLMSSTLLQKVNKMNKSLTSSLELLKKQFGVSENLKLLMPFNSRSRELATYSAKLLNTKINWCWFELNRNLIIMKILLYAINTLENVEPDVDDVGGSLQRKKTIGSVAAVVDYSIADTSIFQKEDADNQDAKSFSSDASFYDCYDDNDIK